VFAELVAGDRRSPCCTVEDGLEADLIAEACGLSLREHRPVRMEELRP
jgi:myo-inositol 2-dehydrogenase / D-chiro-inositol 1-dehydrogenase